MPSPFTESEVSYDASLEAEKSSSSFDEASHTHSDIADDEPIDNAGQSLKEKLASWQFGRWKDPYSSHAVGQAVTHPKTVSPRIAEIYKDSGSN